MIVGRRVRVRLRDKPKRHLLVEVSVRQVMVATIAIPQIVFDRAQRQCREASEVL